jgi:hypothetical protein
MRSATRRPLRKTRPHPLSNRKAALSAFAGTLAWLSPFSPPHDCRLTIRCLKASFGFRVDIHSVSFEALRSENSFIDHFFDRRQNDARAGEGGERIAQIKTRPAFSLHSGRTRGATWFDKSRPPQGIVWLLGAEAHDERHKGSADAYDIFAALDANGTLWPIGTDYKLLELDRRRLDTATFADDVRSDATTLVTQAAESGRASGTLAGVGARLVWERDAGGSVTLHVAISTQPIVGPRSGLEFALTQHRFVLLSEAVRQAAEDLHKPEVLAEEIYDFPGGLSNERAFVLVFEP